MRVQSQPRSRNFKCVLWGPVNFGGRWNIGGAKRAIKGETQSISADYWFLVPSA
jgi:hypothetical protein